MIWAYETTIDIDGTDVVFGWDVINVDHPGSFFEPPSYLEIEWEQLSHDHIDLDSDTQAYIDRVLRDELADMKRDAEESIAESRAWERRYA